jgi:hypothetical protein
MAAQGFKRSRSYHAHSQDVFVRFFYVYADGSISDGPPVPPYVAVIEAVSLRAARRQAQKRHLL